MRIAAAFDAADRSNKFLFLDDEGTFLHSPPPTPTVHLMRLTKGAELGRRWSCLVKKLCKTRRSDGKDRCPVAVGRVAARIRSKRLRIGLSDSPIVTRSSKRAGRLELPLSKAVHCKGQNMQHVRRYRRFAARCLEEARGTIDPRLKAFLGEMAQEWQRLAEQAKSEVNGNFRGPEADPGD
jgi:hypothetical protein